MGCILGEMLLRRPVWPGTNAMDQIDRILGTVGVPTMEQIQGEGSFGVKQLGFTSCQMRAHPRRAQKVANP